MVAAPPVLSNRGSACCIFLCSKEQECPPQVPSNLADAVSSGWGTLLPNRLDTGWEKCYYERLQERKRPCSQVELRVSWFRRGGTLASGKLYNTQAVENRTSVPLLYI